MHSKKNTLPKLGFTLVELVVVIAVIGILASVTIVAYGSWRNQTSKNEVKSDLENVATAMESYRNFNNVYPTTIPTNFTSSPDVTLALTTIGSGVSDYCITGTSNVNASIVYYYQPSVSTTPQTGSCPSAAPTIVNLDPNPGVESNTTTFTTVGTTTISRDTTTSYSGSASLKVAMPAGPAGNEGTGLYVMGSGVPSILSANTTYQISAWVYVPSATGTLQLSVQGSGYTSRTNGSTYTTTVKNTWVRLSNSFTTGTSGSINLYVLNVGTNATSMTFWVDDVELTSGTTLYNYGDGNTTGWTWNGTTNNSTSSGPAP